MASDAQASNGFGHAVAVDGDTLVAGSPSENGGAGNPISWAGAAYVFERNEGGAGNWGEVIKLMAEDAEAEDIFGSGTAVSSNGLIFIGALDGDADGPPEVADSRVAYIFDLTEPASFSLNLPVVLKQE